MPSANPARLALLAIASMTLAATPTLLASHAPAAALSIDEDESRAKALEVIHRYIDAIGGEDVIRAHTSMTQKGSFALPAAGLAGDMTVYAQAPNLLALKVDLPGVGQITSGYNGKVGWSNNPFEGATIMEDQQLRDIQIQADMFNILTPEKYYDSITYEGEQTFEGQKVHAVKLDDDESSPTTQYYSVDSGLLVGSSSLQSGNFGEVEVKSIVSDYKKFDDMLIATKTKQVIGVQVIELTIDDVSFDKIDPDVFALPPAIQALVDAQQPSDQPAQAP